MMQKSEKWQNTLIKNHSMLLNTLIFIQVTPFTLTAVTHVRT